MSRFEAVVVVAVSAGTVIGCAGGAAATSVIGAGNAAFSNSCHNIGGHAGRAVTTAGTGLLTGLVVGLPADSPTNQCGNLGLPDHLFATPNGYIQYSESASL
ncbi:hypothetical protein [Streptomyces sp. NPDC001546]|uniref:hypothetical protein n=1 Tax=Streptomyces sp. NPDC001546 TaxID=3364585 RepID=UPI0036AB930F